MTTDKPTQQAAKKELDREYLKKQMRERAATEAPESNEESSHLEQEAVDTKAKPVSKTLRETKEAIVQVAEKLEQLADQVAEPATHGRPKQSRSKKPSKGA